MLVLTRKIGEAIRIGPDVTVRVLEVRGGQVRLGLAAPTGIRIFREEVFRAMESNAAPRDSPDPQSDEETPATWDPETFGEYRHPKRG